MLFIAATLLAQTPQAFKYQAVARDGSGNVLVSQNASFQLSILQGSTVGISVYTETHAVVTNEFGLVNLEIGNGTPVSGNFSAIDWGADSYFIKTEIDETGGSNYQFLGTSQLMSVPYAQHAKTAESVLGSSGGFTHYVGELFGGGIVVAVWKEAGIEHGLIASLFDIGYTQWSNVSLSVGSTARSPVDGQTNTNAIIAQPGHNTSAAKLCDDFTSDGFSDWYLPAIWELNLCYNAAFVVNTILGDPAWGFKLETYWSSTEHTSSVAWYQGFNYGYSGIGGKNDTYRVRAVRRY